MIALRVLNLSLGLAIGVFIPFISVILASRGFAPAEIGLVASLGAVGFTIAVPAWGHLADVRLGRPRTLQVCAIGAGVAVILLLRDWSMAVVVLLFVGFWVFSSSWQPLSDAIAVNALRARRGGYERVRLLASLTFAVGAIGAGFLYDQTGYDASYVLLASGANAARLASQIVSPSRSAAIQSAFGTFTPDVVPFQVKTMSASARLGQVGQLAIARLVRRRVDFQLDSLATSPTQSSPKFRTQTTSSPCARPASTRKQPRSRRCRSRHDADAIVRRNPQHAARLVDSRA